MPMMVPMALSYGKLTVLHQAPKWWRIFLAAAVADFTPTVAAEQKIKKSEGGLELVLKKTEDILKSLGKVKKQHQVLVGFALETANEKANALKKLEEKNADLIVLNSLNDYRHWRVDSQEQLPK